MRVCGGGRLFEEAAEWDEEINTQICTFSLRLAFYKGPGLIRAILTPTSNSLQCALFCLLTGLVYGNILKINLFRLHAFLE